jgi:hypothetical protein
MTPFQLARNIRGQAEKANTPPWVVVVEASVALGVVVQTALRV